VHRLLTLLCTTCQDRSFTFILKTSPASVLLKKAAGMALKKQGYYLLTMQVSTLLEYATCLFRPFLLFGVVT
jgi:hypothetical protein